MPKKEEGIVLVKNTPEYQQKRKSRKKASKQAKKEGNGGVVASAGKTHQKKKPSGGPSKQKKQKKQKNKSSGQPGEPSGTGSSLSVVKQKTVQQRATKKKKVAQPQPLTSAEKPPAVFKVGPPLGRSFEMNKESRELRQPKALNSQTAMSPSENMLKQAEEQKKSSAEKESKEKIIGVRDSKTEQHSPSTAKEPTVAEAYLGHQLNNLISKSSTREKRAAVPVDVAHQQTPAALACVSFQPSNGAKPAPSPHAPAPQPPALNAQTSQEQLRSSQLKPPVETLKVQTVMPPPPQTPQQAQTPRQQMGLNVDEVLRLGALMDRCGATPQRKAAFDWLAQNRVVAQSRPAKTSAYLMTAVGDVECDKLLAANSFQELQKAGILTAEEVARLLAILDTIRPPLTVAHLAYLVHSEGSYYRTPNH